MTALTEVSKRIKIIEIENRKVVVTKDWGN